MATGAEITRYREEGKIDANEVLQLKPGNVFAIGPGDYQRVQVAMRDVDQARWEHLYHELEHQAKEEPPPMPRKGPGEPRVVDSTLASGSNNGSTSGAQKPGTSSSTKKSSKQSAGKQRQNGARPTKPAPLAPPKAKKQSGQPATPPSPPGKAPDVDETLPFALPEGDPNAKTQRGVLPMWNEKDEDLLP